MFFLAKQSATKAKANATFQWYFGITDGFSQGHVQIISIFPVRDIRLRFSFFKSKNLSTYWSNYSDFCIITKIASRSTTSHFFGRLKFFGGVFGKKTPFLDFPEGKAYSSELSLQ